MNTLKKFESFEELKADAKPATNMEEAIRRHEEFKELIYFFQNKRVDKFTLKEDKNEK
jgi:hypothetical protein